MRISRNYEPLFKKLGLKGAYEASLVNNPANRNRDTSAALSRASFEFENVGTLKFISPRLVIKVPFNTLESNNYKVQSFRTWKAPIQENEYVYTKYTASIDLKSNPLGFFHFPKLNFDVQSNDFFKKYTDRIYRFKKVESSNWNNNSARFTSFEGKAPIGNIPVNKKFGYDNTPLSYFNKRNVYNSSAYGYNDLPFTRIHFSSGNTNNIYAQKIEQNDYLNITGLVLYSERSSVGYDTFDFNQENLSGFYQKYFSTGSGSNIESYNKKFSKSLKPSKFLEWNSSFTNGLASSNYLTGGFESSKKYYIPYPTTVQSKFFHRIGCATKFAFLDNLNNNLSINGLLLISTGATNSSSKICYISPHKINPIVANTLDDFYISKTKSFATGFNQYKLVTQYEQTSEVFQVNILQLTSQYNNFSEPSNVLDRNLSNPDWVDFLSVGKFGLDTWNSTYTYTESGSTYKEPKNLGYDNDYYLSQLTPIKDTPYYKFYKNIYTGAKTFNTGVWDGIIPSGAHVQVELISNIFDAEAGISLDGILVYSGHGTKDPIDLKINSVFNGTNCQKNLQRTNKNGLVMSYTASSTAESYSESVIRAKNLATDKLSENIFKMLKIEAPELLKFNRKYRTLKQFQQKINNKKLKIGIYDYINNYKTSETTY